jgi:uncharacterized protein
MLYKIKDIPSEGMLVQLDLPRTLLADALEGLDADLDASTGNLRVELTKDRDENVYVRGDVKALVTVPCSSCLGPALVKVATPLNMTFVEEGAEVEASEDPLDDVDVATHDGEHVDLAPIVREQIILSVPMSPHCRENCAGLCATCGQNKNERDCGHTAVSLEDPRFSALKNLKLEKQ